MATPTLQDEVAYITSVSASGTLAQTSFYGWNRNTPATYNTTWTSARKWGANTAGTSGGTVSFYFDPGSAWTDVEKGWFAGGLALWSAIANIKFVQVSSAPATGITFKRTNDNGSYTYPIYNPGMNACRTGGTLLGTMALASVNIDTSGTSFGPIKNLASQGGFTIENLLHEEGHALGLGHAGPYDGSINVATQQFSVYDTRQYSVMSYIEPSTTGTKYYSQYPVKAWYGGLQPTTPMMADILGIQRLYGVPTTTPLDGGEVFGFNCNIAGAIRPFFDFTQNTKPVITIWDKGTGNTLDLSGFTGTATVNLNPGTFSSTCGLANNIAIAQGTRIDKLVCTSGGTKVTCNPNGNTVTGGAGADTILGGNGNDTLKGGGGNDKITGGLGINIIDGGTGTDTTLYTGNRSSYTITRNSNGTITVARSGSSDTLSAVEILQFADLAVTASTTILADGTFDDMSAPLDTSDATGWDTSLPGDGEPGDWMIAAGTDDLSAMTLPPPDALANAAPAAAPGRLFGGSLPGLEPRTAWLAATA